ncbi:MAG: Uncharacterized protein Athens041674_528 [Parcubacteria group bacterium Athens0416_74]|nr:MAG: Uncharacterized protein Athens041674_528 [Parcubacteria group bacterium Athens0416_74]
MVPIEGVILGLVTAVLFSCFALMGRSMSTGSESPLSSSFIYGAYASVFAVPLLWYGEWEFSDMSYVVILITVIATFFYGMYDTFQFFARKHIQASQYTVMFQVLPIIVLVGSALFLNETVYVEKVGAMGLIILGNIVALSHNFRTIPRRGLAFMAITVVSVAFAYVADKAVLHHYPIGFYAFLMFVAPSAYVLGAMLVVREPFRNVVTEFKRASWKLPIISILGVVGYFSFLLTLSKVDASIAVTLAYTSTVLTTIGGIVILKERDGLMRKIIGAFVVFTGVALLANL